MRIHHSISLIILAATALACALAAGAARPATDTEADRRKAEYIFLEAANAYEEKRFDDYFMLLRRASLLDPADPYIAGSLAETQLTNRTSDSATIESAYSALGRRWLAAPADEHYAALYASVAKDLGRIDDVIKVWSTLDSLSPQRTDPAMNLASALLARSQAKADTADYNRAMAIYHRLQKGVKGSIPLASRKIYAYAMRNDTAAVVAELERLAEEAPADIQANLVIGSVFGSFQMPDSALRYFDRACELDSTNGMVYLARADFFQQRGDSAAYDREVFRALESPELEFEPKFQLLSDYVVKLYSDTAQRPRIDQLFEILQVVNPGEAPLHAFYGAYKATVDELPAAAEQYGYSLDLDPENEEVWQNLASVYSTMGQTDKVSETCLAASARFPGNPYFRFMAASAFTMQKQQDKALAVLDSLDVESLPTDRLRSVYYATRGDILYSKEDSDSAFAEYNKAIELDPENYMAMNNAAYYMAVKGKNLDKAELYSSIATAGEPDNTTYLDTQAWVMFKKKEFKKAREIIDKALALYGLIETESEKKADDEPSSEIFDHAGDIYFMTGDPKEALEFWKEALELDPDNASIKKKVDNKAYFFEE